MDQYDAFRRRNDEVNRRNEERRWRDQDRADQERRHRERLRASSQPPSARAPEKPMSFKMIVFIIIFGAILSGIGMLLSNDHVRASIQSWLKSIMG